MFISDECLATIISVVACILLYIIDSYMRKHKKK